MLARAREDVEDFVQRHPRRSVAGLILLVVLVGLGIWAWPEFHRTIRIHRM